MIQLRTIATVFLAGGLLAVVGCGGSSVKTHTVKGRLTTEGIDSSRLAGHIVEAVSVDDPQVRAAGEIADDGTFSLETLHNGAIHRGALAGQYQVRLVLSDDDPEQRNELRKTIPDRYLDFQQSGLHISVPAVETVTLPVLLR